MGLSEPADPEEAKRQATMQQMLEDEDLKPIMALNGVFGVFLRGRILNAKMAGKGWDLQAIVTEAVDHGSAAVAEPAAEFLEQHLGIRAGDMQGPGKALIGPTLLVRFPRPWKGHHAIC